MPSADGSGPFRSKIAGIQEDSNFPQVDNGLPASQIDLQVRSGFAKHLLVGLNVFFIEMGKQFNSVLGIPITDPMLVSQGVAPLELTEQTMLDSGVRCDRDDLGRRRIDGRNRIACQRDCDQQDRSQISVWRRVPPCVRGLRRDG